MAGEIIAALRTVVLFISVSWLSIMYLLVYRFPRLDRSYQTEQVRGGGERIQHIHAQSHILEEGSVDLENRGRKLQYASMNQHTDQEPSKSKSFDLNSEHSMFFDCRSLDDVELLQVLGSGYTKTVRKGVLNGQQFAMKYTTARNHDIIECRKQRPKTRHFECFNLAKFKLLKEAMLFQQLRHPNIVKVSRLII